MTLFEQFGNRFNPANKSKLDELKQQAYDLFVAFKAMTPDHDCFYETMEAIEKQINTLKFEYAYYPSWEHEFETHSDRYYDLMAFKVFKKVDLIHAVGGLIESKDIEPINYN